MASMWDWLPGPSGLWDYLSQYPERYRDQIREGLLRYSERPGALSAGPLVTSFNPLGPFAEDVTEQAAPLVEPLAAQQNRMYEALTGEEGQLRGEHIAGPLIGSVFRGRLPDVGKTGFFSPTSRALAKAQDKASGKQFAKVVKKLKQEPSATGEATQGGLIELLEEAPGTMTKEQALSMWNPVELTETVRANDSYRDSLLAEAGDKRQAAGERLRSRVRELTGFELRAPGIDQPSASGWERELRSLNATGKNVTGDPEIMGLLSDIRRYDDQDKRLLSVPKTKYGSDQNLNLPGGTNAKEILVQLPVQPLSLEEFSSRFDVGPGANRIQGYYQEYLDNFAKGKEQSDPLAISGDVYTGGHYDEPNVLAHIRTNERDVGGRKALHIEEIQSDWHQQGQKKGYKGAELPPITPEIQSKINRYMVLEQTGNATDEEALALRRELRPWYPDETRSVPDAPFKKNWHELAFKRALTEAVNDPSIERLTWTTGAVQADRYNLAKYLDGIEAQAVGDNFNLAVSHKDGRVENLQNIPRDKLTDYVGKEMAEKIVNDAIPPNYDVVKTNRGYEITVDGELEGGWYDSEQEAKHAISQYETGDMEAVGGKPAIYSGLDLEVGGEFHKNLYDGKITGFAKKFLKKYGVEPEKWQADSKYGTAVDSDGNTYYIGGSMDDEGGNWHIWKQSPEDASGNWVDDVLMETPGDQESAHEALKKYGKLQDSPYDVWYIDITPEMREEIMTQGVPLTQRRKQMGLMAGYA